jgi:hypothetical protein
MVDEEGPVTVVVLSQVGEKRLLVEFDSLYVGGPMGGTHCPRCSGGRKLDTSTMVFGPTDATEMHVFQFASMAEAQAWVDRVARDDPAHPLKDKVVYAIIRPESTRGDPLTAP